MTVYHGYGFLEYHRRSEASRAFYLCQIFSQWNVFEFEITLNHSSRFSYYNFQPDKTVFIVLCSLRFR